MTKEIILTACENLAESLTREELKNFICNENHRFNEERAENFLTRLWSFESSRDQLKMFKIRAALICSWIFYSFDFRSSIKEDLNNFIAIEKDKAEKEAQKRFEEQQKTKFKETLVKFYNGELTEDQIEEIFNTNHRNFYTEYRATIKKIKNKLKTKNHNIEKILKVIEEDIERGYFKSIQMWDIVYKQYREKANLHWFWY